MLMDNVSPERRLNALRWLLRQFVKGSERRHLTFPQMLQSESVWGEPTNTVETHVQMRAPCCMPFCLPSGLNYCMLLFLGVS